MSKTADGQPYFVAEEQKHMDKPIINDKPQTELRTADFDYDLPQRLIAQHPAEKRDGSRLMVINRGHGSTEHRHFYDIINYIKPEDTLVINDSKVIPARLFGCFDGNPEKPVELLLLRSRGLDLWETLVRPGKRARVGASIVFGGGELVGTVTDIVEEGNRFVHFDYDREKHANVYEILSEIGLMPLPPYITEKPEDPSRYQTVYAREEGSAAAPTAGLHFTKELLDRIRAQGTEIVPVMLHVGLGTFRPVKSERVDEHIMHTEYISVTEKAAETINRRRAAGGRTIAVGTTSCRTLESVSDDSGRVHAISGDTGIFIYPGYRFKAVDALITNFHLPQSTLLMLVSAFWNRDGILNAYRTAVEEEYRFFSFGDAMLIE